jgi:hypothetical protein
LKHSPNIDAISESLVNIAITDYLLIDTSKIDSKEGQGATILFTTPVQVLLNTVRDFQRSQKKQGVDFDPLSTMAPPAGLEPATL